MSIGKSVRLIVALALAQCLGLAAAARAQAPDSSSSSVADAAKRAQEQKKNAASAKKVITDDDLHPNDVKPGDEGLKTATPQLETEPPSPAAVAADEAADKKAESSPADDPVKATDPAKVAAVKAELAKAEEDVQLIQRESALQQDTFYSNPDFQHDTAGKAKLAELLESVSEKQQTVEQLKARLAELEASLKKEAPAGATPTAAASAPASDNSPATSASGDNPPAAPPQQ
jgi:hypothetical protein